MQDSPVEPPPKIEGRVSLEAWLRRRPRADALIIATRAALRAMPLIAEAKRLDDWPAAIVLPVLRAIASPWLASLGVSHRDAARAARAATVAATVCANSAAIARATAASAGASAAAYAASATATAAAARAAADAARDAARATRAAAPADAGRAAAALWAAVESDAAALMSGDRLSGKKLWHDEQPPPAIAHTLKTLRQLLEEKGEWDVWLSWYQARLDGHDPRPALTFECAVAALTEDDWSQGPAEVNAKLKAALEDPEGPSDEVQLPVVPEERPAPAHFEVVEDLLVLTSPLPPDLSDEQRNRAKAAHRALREAFEDFAEMTGAAQQRGVMRVIERCESALGPDFHVVDVVRLGHHAARLQAHADRADEIYLPETAAELVGLNSQLSLFMAQFNEWADYLAGARDPLASAEAEKDGVQLGVAMIRTLRNNLPEAISEHARTELEVQADEATGKDGAEEVPAELAATSRRSFLRSLRSAIRGFAVFIVENYQKGVGKGIETVAKTTTVAAFAAIKVELLALARIIPAEYAWVEGVVTLVARLLG
ncbi:MAG: hypothetical protein AAF844_17865 [Pseudomonadota bacterium]